MGEGKVVNIKTVIDPRGRLSVIQGGADIPFMPKRVYYLYASGGTVVRGKHAHKTLRQFMFAANGRARVTIDDGESTHVFDLDSPDRGLLLEPIMWREIELQPDTVLCVLASEAYDPADYIHDYQEFKRQCCVAR